MPWQAQHVVKAVASCLTYHAYAMLSFVHVLLTHRLPLCSAQLNLIRASGLTAKFCRL